MQLQKIMPNLIFLKNRREGFIFLTVTICIIISTANYISAQTKTIEQDSSNNNIESKFLKMISVKKVQLPGNDIHESDKKMINKYSGRIIRNINVRVLDVFGASLDNPEDTSQSWLEDKGNSLHYKSREWIIKNKLIFTEGEELTPFNVQESERIIRESPYIYDVRIVPQKVNNDSKNVDIIVYAQDLWSTNGSLKYHPGGKTGSLSIDDINFLGLGNEFMGGPKFDPSYNRGWDWDGSYAIDNFGRLFLSGKIYYFSDIYRQQYGVNVGREFFSPIIQWAGAVSQNWQITKYPVLKDSSIKLESAKYNQQDYWLGYAFDLKPFDPNTVYQNRFNIAGRITRTVYSRIPEFDTIHLFQDNTFYLSRIGYSYKKFYQDRYILGLGKTEDIPLINIVELLWGFEKGANANQIYYGFKSGYSLYNYYWGYIYGGFQAGTFRKNNKWEDQNAFLEMLYFSKLMPLGNFYMRQYLGSRYSVSLNPFGTDILDINNADGLRGFSDNQLTGSKKLILNYEADIFAPLKILGFNLAFITFTDFGLISTTNEPLFSSKLYQGYGVGFRIKNEQLIFPQFQFSIGFYPNLPEERGNHFNMFTQSSIFNEYNSFTFSAPSIVIGH